MGLAGVGVAVPGMPTTIFLILASWCFARSCPWLTDKLIRNRFFGPFVRYLEPGAAMPVRAKLISLGLMGTAIVGSSVLVLWRGAPWFVPVFIASFGAIGTWFIVRQGRAARSAQHDRRLRHGGGRHGSSHAAPRRDAHAARV